MSAGPSAKGGGEGPANRYQKPPTPKKSVTTKVVDAGKNLITARRKTAYKVAKIIPGEDKRLRKNRTDYRNYLTSKGSTPDFLMDDKNLTSFETYDKLISYKPTQRNPNEKVALNYADYLAEEKGNYNLQRAGNVGGINETGEGRNNEVANTIIKKNVGGKTVQTTEAKIEEEKKEYDARQTKKKGRNKNILTSQRGVMKTSADYSLGKKSLLGQVV